MVVETDSDKERESVFNVFGNNAIHGIAKDYLLGLALALQLLGYGMQEILGVELERVTSPRCAA